jgi:glycosyltransferase involved in cell wall biosynthesis
MSTPAAGTPPYVTIVLPCFNERGHVVAELERITAAMDGSGYTYDLDVYDDCSTDGTRELLAEVVPQFPRVRYLPRHRNGGSGTIRRIGTENARGAIVVWTDADMTYPNDRIPEFVKLLDDDPTYDQIVGARSTEEGTYKLLAGAGEVVHPQGRLPPHRDRHPRPQLGPARVPPRRRAALPQAAARRLLLRHHADMAFLSNGHDVDYVPITYAKRAGKSKFHFTKDAYRYLLRCCG